MHDLDLMDRKTLMASLPHGGLVAEIGVAGGEFSAVILELNQPRELWLIDCWEHQSADVIGHDLSNAPQEAQEALYQQVQQRFAAMPQVQIMKAYSLIAAMCFSDGYFDGLYFDANHRQVYQDIEAWWPKVRPGGWMAGHDYTVAGDHITVKTDVDRFVAERGLELFVTRGDTDVYENNYPSWVFGRP